MHVLGTFCYGLTCQYCISSFVNFYGPAYTQACKDFENNGTCVTQCPPPIIYDPNLFQLVPNPDHRLAAGDLCVEECPREFLSLCVSFDDLK